ncbi:MAG: outer membrane protein assembly factor BamC [Porticoccaceae bacterium]
MKKTISWLTILLVLVLSGCNWLGVRNRTNDYLLSEETQPTVIPGEMDSASLGQIYPIPQIAVETIDAEGFEVPRPQPASVNTFEQLVKIQSIDDRRWVLINISPSEVWPRIRSLLNRNGVPSAKAEGSSGIIETVWVTFKSDQDNSHRFRFYISPGVQLDSTEITTLHQQIAVGEEDAVAAWPTTSNSEDRERDMLSMIANELAAASEYASVSLLAQDIGGEAKVEVVTPEAADAFIKINLSFDRAWASVSYSAARGGFSIIDKNRTEGLLYVNYSEQTEGDEGFFSRWFGSSDSEELLEANYKVLMESVGSSIEARIVGFEGNSLDRAESLRLLRILRGNMS